MRKKSKSQTVRGKKIKVVKNSITQIGIKLKNTNCDKTQKLKFLQNLNCGNLK